MKARLFSHHADNLVDNSTVAIEYERKERSASGVPRA